MKDSSFPSSQRCLSRFSDCEPDVQSGLLPFKCNVNWRKVECPRYEMCALAHTDLFDEEWLQIEPRVSLFQRIVVTGVKVKYRFIVYELNEDILPLPPFPIV